jgi:hypothetical protein
MSECTTTLRQDARASRGQELWRPTITTSQGPVRRDATSLAVTSSYARTSAWWMRGTLTKDNTRSSGAGVELAPALPEARPPIRARTSEPAHFGDPTGTVNCQVGVGGCRWRSWHRQQRPCITGASRARHLAAFRGIADRRETGWLSQIRRPDDSWGEESGLQACYRKTPRRGVFPLPAPVPRVRRSSGPGAAGARAPPARSLCGATPRPGSDTR